MQRVCRVHTCGALWASETPGWFRTGCFASAGAESCQGPTLHSVHREVLMRSISQLLLRSQKSRNKQDRA
eukprot:12896684-Prorocentrum_lima.AAC.1